jgi:2-C-methyl-D-erythritol 4-phosphate cytidylyltransferase
MDEAKRKYGAHLGFSGVKLLSGGPKWMDQVRAAAGAIAPECTHVILHDAARPVVPFSDIDAVMECAETKAAVALTSPVRSTLVELDEGNNPVAYHFPSRFVHLLTPQVFAKERFVKMAETGVEVHPSEVSLVKGSPLNVRIGGGGEERMAKAMLNMLPKPKVRAPSSPFEEAQW